MRLRTIREAAEHLRQADSCTAITEHLLRSLIAERKIKSIKRGNRHYIDIDNITAEIERAMK